MNAVSVHEKVNVRNVKCWSVSKHTEFEIIWKIWWTCTTI